MLATKMPVLIIVGDKDEGTPLSHQQILFQAVPKGNKALEVIKGAEHNFRTEEELTTLKQLVNEWLKNFKTIWCNSRLLPRQQIHTIRLFEYFSPSNHLIPNKV